MKNPRRIQLLGEAIGPRAGDQNVKALGVLLWDAQKGLVYSVTDNQAEAKLKRAIKARIREGRYYIAAAVRSGQRVSGLQFERVSAAVPEILRCIAADEDLWRATYAGYRITPLYREAADAEPEPGVRPGRRRHGA